MRMLSRVGTLGMETAAGWESVGSFDYARVRRSATLFSFKNVLCPVVLLKAAPYEIKRVLKFASAVDNSRQNFV